MTTYREPAAGAAVAAAAPRKAAATAEVGRFLRDMIMIIIMNMIIMIMSIIIIISCIVFVVCVVIVMVIVIVMFSSSSNNNSRSNSSSSSSRSSSTVGNDSWDKQTVNTTAVTTKLLVSSAEISRFHLEIDTWFGNNLWLKLQWLQSACYMYDTGVCGEQHPHVEQALTMYSV